VSVWISLKDGFPNGIGSEGGKLRLDTTVCSSGGRAGVASTGGGHMGRDDQIKRPWD